MEKKELEEKLRGLVIFTEGDGQGQATNTTLEEELGEYAMQKVLDLFSQELDRAREEGRREYFSMGMEYFSLMDDSNIYQQKGWKLSEEKAKRLQILDKIFNLILKTKEDEK